MIATIEVLLFTFIWCSMVWNHPFNQAHEYEKIRLWFSLENSPAVNLESLCFQKKLRKKTHPTRVTHWGTAPVPKPPKPPKPPIEGATQQTWEKLNLQNVESFSLSFSLMSQTWDMKTDGFCWSFSGSFRVFRGKNPSVFFFFASGFLFGDLFWDIQDVLRYTSKMQFHCSNRVTIFSKMWFNQHSNYILGGGFIFF